MDELVESFKPDTMMHMAALLSATAEKNPLFAWDLNMGGLMNALEVAREYKLQFFTPSSIGALVRQHLKLIHLKLRFNVLHQCMV